MYYLYSVLCNDTTFYTLALRRLTEKARLLGYEVEVGLVGTDARRKIAPSLTVEFVNYFSGK